MSYSFQFLPPAMGSDPREIHRRLEEGELVVADRALAAERNARIRDALVREDPALVPFEFDFEAIAKFEKITVEEARRRHDHIELNGPEDGPGMQIVLFPGTASIAIPFWHEGSEAVAVIDQVRRYARVMVAEGGYRILDPQLNRICDDLAEIRADVLRNYAGVVDRLPEIVERVQRKLGES
jgi:hypothetical protein